MSQPDLSTKRPGWQTIAAFVVVLVAFIALAFAGQGSGRFEGQMIAWSAVLVAVLLALVWIDLDRFLLPDMLTLPLIVSGVAYSALAGGGIWLSLFGALVGYSLIAGLAYYWRTRLGREGIGLGDAKLLAAGGAWVGLFGIPLILLVGSSAALAMVAIMTLLGRRPEGQTTLPFGPMLAVGIWSIWCLPFLLP